MQQNPKRTGKRVNNRSNNPDMINQNHRSTIPLTPRSAKGAFSGMKRTPNLGNLPVVIGVADNVLDAINPGYKERIGQVAIDAGGRIVSGGRDFIRDLNRLPVKAKPVPTASPLMPVFSDKSAKANSSYALSKAPNPKNININSGIKPNTYSNDYMLPIEGACSPLHMTIVDLLIPTAATNPLALYYKNTICFDIQTRAQANVGFALDITNILSADKLIVAMNASIRALQTYFYYSSILSYESDPRNKNAGMIALRGLVDSQTLSDLSQLGKRLEDTPIPPRIVEWVRYMNGNFLSGPSQGAPIIKLGLDATQFTSQTFNDSPSTCLAALNAADNLPIYSLLRRAIPQWRVGTLYDCHPSPTFDLNFLSIFANIPAFNKNANIYTYPNNVADLITSVSYNAFDNKLDGLAFAMSGIRVGTDFIPGLCVPFGANTANIDCRYSYYAVGGVRGFYPVCDKPFLALSRAESAPFLAGTGYLYPHISGAEKCQAVTGNSLLQTAQEAVDFLFNINTIPLKGTVNHFSSRGYRVIDV